MAYKIAGITLVFVHVLLALWAAGGMAEWLFRQVPWKPFSNPEFPRWLLFFHWSTVLFASGIFLYGYLTRWSETPKWMMVAYGLMALVCVVETFGYMTSKTKYIAMALEYAAYILIILLLHTPRFWTSS